MGIVLYFRIMKKNMDNNFYKPINKNINKDK